MTSRTISIVLGLFYVISGIGKLLDVSAFLLTVYSYHLPDEAVTILSIAIPPIEILLGFGLLLFVRTRGLAVVSVILLTLFTAGFAYAHFANGVNHCGCFGVISPLETTPLISLGRNLLLLGLSVLLFRRPVPAGPVRWQLALLSVIGAVSFALSGISMDHPLYAPEPLLHKRIQDTPMDSLVHTNPDSTYLVFVMSVTCPHCWNATENVKAYKTLNRVNEIIALGIGTDSTAAIYKAHFNPNFEIRLISNKTLSVITGGYIPKAFFVRRDSIVSIKEWDIPSPWSSELED